MKVSLKQYLLPLAATLVFTVACSREATQNQPVKTTTEGGSTTAPASADAANRDKALIRVVNAIPSKPAVDAFAGESKTFFNVAYKSVTPYVEIPDDFQKLTLKPSGQADLLAENNESFSEGKHYTVLALPGVRNEKPELRVVSDDLTPMTNGKARVRVINASPDAGELDIYTMNNAEKLFSGVNFKSEAGYTEINPTTTVVEVRHEGKKEALLMLPQFSFEPNKTYTIVVMGHVAGKHLDAVTVEDQLTGSYAQR
jgi:hypothetical protein